MTRPVPAEQPLIETLERLFGSGEQWLMNRVLAYAQDLGYTKYASSLEEAWRVSVHGLTDSLLEAARISGCDLEIRCEEDVSRDPAVAFGVHEARQHRSRGIPFEMFLSLMKYYGQAYRDLCGTLDEPAEAQACSLVVTRFFDRVEIGFSTEWAGLGEQAAVAELQDRNRITTDEKVRYITVFESLNVPVVLFDQGGRVENINEAAANTFGITAVTGSAYYSHIAVGSSFAPLDTEIAEFLDEGSVEREFERTLQTVSGPRHYIVRLKRMQDISGRFKGLTAVLSDVTERKHLEIGLEQLVAQRTAELEVSVEQLALASRIKDDFLASMSHELRTPLNSIIGFSGILSQGLAGPLNHEQHKQIGIIRESGERLLSLVNDVLDLTRIESGKVEVLTEEFDLVVLARQMIETVQPMAVARGLDISVESFDEIVPMWTDREKVGQILLNLLSNAIKYTSKGRVRVRIEQSRDGMTAMIAVIDTGSGIPPEDMDGLFDRFTTVRGLVRKVEDGAGLGLSISRRLATILGGTLTAESVLGKGSTFVVRLPVRHPQADV